jgi:hypothetical protein
MEARGVVSIGVHSSELAFIDDATVCTPTGNGLVLQHVTSGHQVSSVHSIQNTIPSYLWLAEVLAIKPFHLFVK